MRVVAYDKLSMRFIFLLALCVTVSLSYVALVHARRGQHRQRSTKVNPRSQQTVHENNKVNAAASEKATPEAGMCGQLILSDIN